ncbi:ricin-type beta-trefoil lectin domain protein [Rhizoctonia solani 123E]|uniref:Ricin-type beta-trefoil lectin domain protein n=1 Tax=Rhizoctonia solani 123E TaxID=1423351 RepID=A0A074SV88_9AGAM|nr:ricin-type beta-trefoil lectin domain protein [Rhizoctonia solani 123E]
MGQEISHSQYPPDQDLKPGTYRILNALAGTAIQTSDDDPTKVVAWEQHGGENQQWLLQRSGEGYQLQNRRHHVYLAVCNTDNHALVYASRYPTTWVFLKSGGNYIIQFADRNRVLDLHNGLGHNGNEIHIWNVDGNNMAHRTWRLERLGDDSGNKELTGIQEEIANKNKELLQLQGELSTAKQELSDLHSLLYQRDETIRQLQQDLKLKEEASSHAYEASESSAQLRNQHHLSQSKISQQQTEIASLQAKMDRVEYLMSQMMSKPGGNTGTSGTT